jgi:VCBS repeat protein/FG-GAP repeat protein
LSVLSSQFVPRKICRYITLETVLTYAARDWEISGLSAGALRTCSEVEVGMKRLVLSVGSALLIIASGLLANNSTRAVLADPQTSVSFGKAITFNSEVLFPTSLAAGDLNGDGFPDLAVVSEDDDQGLAYGFGSGNGRFGLWRDYADIETVPFFVLLADADGDGNLDALTTDIGCCDDIGMAFGDGKGGFHGSQFLTVGGGNDGTATVAVADLNGDGIPDIVGTSLGAGGQLGSVFVLLGKGHRKFAKAFGFSSDGQQPHGIAVGDLNHDGIPDLAVANADSGGVTVFLGKGDGTFGKPTHYRVGAGTWTLVLGDFNGDGNLDMAVGAFSNRIYVLLGNGDGTFGPSRGYAGGSGVVAAADFNGDGKLDLATARGGVSVLLGNGDGTFQKPVDFDVHGAPGDLIVADFNHDGKPDIATISAPSTAAVLLNTTPFPTSSHP